MLYSISYDLGEGSQEQYAAIETALGRLGPSIRCLGSTWLLVSDETANEIKKHLCDVIGENLECLITQIQGVNNSWRLASSRGVKKWRMENAIEMG